MDIIHKFIPKNPINGDTMNKITERCQEVLKYFGECYAKQTMLVLVGNKEADYEYQEQRKAFVEKNKQKQIKYYKMNYPENLDIPDIPEIPPKDADVDTKRSYSLDLLSKGLKPVFPRGKYEPFKPPEVRLQLTRYIIRDKEYDPYATYIIVASDGTIVVEKERRFREFEKLNKAIKKMLPKDAILPPASSKIGGRNLTENFLRGRVESLNNYLQKISQVKEIEQSEVFQKFIGLFPSDPLDESIFDAAYRQTKFHFWIWFDAKYDTPGDAMAKLLTRAIWYSISSDIYAALPTAEAPRRASIKLAYKLIAGVVDKAVPPAWDAAYNAGKVARNKIQSVLDKVIGIILKTKNELNEKIKDAMKSAFQPIRECVGKLFTMGINQVVPPIVKPFAFIYKTYEIKTEPLILESFKNCDALKLKEAVGTLNKIHEDLVAKLRAKIDEELKTICENLKGAVTLTYLQDCFNPMKAIGVIISDFIRMIDPSHWSKIAEVMFDYKKKIASNNGDDLDAVLSLMERHALSERGYQSYLMNKARYWVRGDIYNLGLDLDLIGDVCFTLGGKLIKKVYRKSTKKFIRKFSDYIWGFKNQSQDYRPWNEKVDQAFELAYKAAKHKFNKECGNMIKEFIIGILVSPVLNKVIEEINKVVGSVLQTLTSVIPDEVKDLIDIEDMAQKDIEEVLRSTFEGAIYDQDGPFVEILNAAIKDCEISE